MFREKPIIRYDCKYSAVRNPEVFDVVSEMKGAISWAWANRILIHRGISARRAFIRWKKGRTFYTSNSGLKELRQEICHYLKRRQRLEYDPNTEVMVTVGGSEAN